MSQKFLPGFGFTTDIKPPKQIKPRKCPLCGSDREATRKPFRYADGSTRVCGDPWHEQSPVSGRI